MTRAKSKTPHEAWTGYKPSISHMRPFGCAAFVVPDPITASHAIQRTFAQIVA
ncbi:hypothetical protein V1524DRAFT_443476 [Lipomyces starkeyi]